MYQCLKVKKEPGYTIWFRLLTLVADQVFKNLSESIKDIVDGAIMEHNKLCVCVCVA